MSSNPYENEPGFEDANELSDKKNQADYVQKVCGAWTVKLCSICGCIVLTRVLDSTRNAQDIGDAKDGGIPWARR